MSNFSAIFIDEENISEWFLGNKKHRGSIDNTIDFDKLKEFLEEKGFIIAKIVCYTTPREGSSVNNLSKTLSELAKRGIQLIHVPRFKYGTGSKSLLDPFMIVDILSTAYERPHINCFVIISGDKDFCPVAMKLRELGKRVIFIGPPSSAKIIIENFEFHDILRFYYIQQDKPDPAIPDLTLERSEDKQSIHINSII